LHDRCSNGEQYAGEIHFVHRNPQSNELAVLGFFMKGISQDEENVTQFYNTSGETINEWKRYFNRAEQLRGINDSSRLDFNLTALMGNQMSKFWRYAGSLTVPPCTEGIIWTVFKTPIVFKEYDLNRIRRNLFILNYRYPKPIFNRIVYRNFPDNVLSRVPDYDCSDYAQNVASQLHEQLLGWITMLCLLVQSFSFQ
jgi:carbonic anhydrase